MVSELRRNVTALLVIGSILWLAAFWESRTPDIAVT